MDALNDATIDPNRLIEVEKGRLKRKLISTMSKVRNWAKTNLVGEGDLDFERG